MTGTILITGASGEWEAHYGATGKATRWSHLDRITAGRTVDLLQGTELCGNPVMCGLLNPAIAGSGPNLVVRRSKTLAPAPKEARQLFGSTAH